MTSPIRNGVLVRVFRVAIRANRTRTKWRTQSRRSRSSTSKPQRPLPHSLASNGVYPIFSQRGSLLRPALNALLHWYEQLQITACSHSFITLSSRSAAHLFTLISAITTSRAYRIRHHDRFVTVQCGLHASLTVALPIQTTM